VCSVYKDGVEVCNTSSAAAGAASDAAVEAMCVVGDKFSCGFVLDDDEKHLHVYFLKNNVKVQFTDRLTDTRLMASFQDNKCVSNFRLNTFRDGEARTSCVRWDQKG